MQPFEPPQKQRLPGRQLMEFSVESLEAPALTKANLAELLFEQIGLNKRESKEMIDAFFELISERLIDGKDVKISGFGNFQIRTKAPRPGRNPRTGESIPIEARRVVTFHASHKQDTASVELDVTNVFSEITDR
jgi:integration host factor subunit alpha